MTPSYSGKPRVLVGYDGSDDAYAALNFAIKEAISTDSEIALIYAVDDTVLNSAWGVVFDPEEIKEDEISDYAASDAAKIRGKRFRRSSQLCKL